MARWAMMIDAERCTGCMACALACKTGYETIGGESRNWVRTEGVEGKFPNLRQRFVPGNCMQCDTPYCVYNCPTGASFKGADGIVRIDAEACIGCGYCVEACPYGARFIDPDRGIAEKCDFCNERLAAGREPLCVEVCPSGVRTFGDLHEPKFAKLVKNSDARPLVGGGVNPLPAVFYRGLNENDETANAPRPPREATASMWLRALVNPAVKWMVGLAFLGQAVAYFYQLRHGEKQFEDEE